MEESKLAEGLLASASLAMQAGSPDQWVIRSFELRRDGEDCVIAYFSGAEEARREEGRVSITPNTTICPDESGTMDQSYVMILSDMNNTETYLLSADTEEELEAWISAVQDVIIEQQIAADTDINSFIGGNLPAVQAPQTRRRQGSILVDDRELMPRTVSISEGEEVLQQRGEEEEEEDEEEEGGGASESKEAPAAADAGAASKAGFLSKQGGFVKNWKKRWFVLTAGPRGCTISYFTDQAATDRAGIIQLHSSTVCSAGGAKDAKKRFPFVIQDPTDSFARTYYLMAATAEEREAWIIAINAAIAVATASSSGASEGGVDVTALFSNITHDAEPTPREEPICALTYDTVTPVITPETIEGWCDTCKHYRSLAHGHSHDLLGSIEMLNWGHTKTKGRVTISRLDKRDEPKFLCFKITATLTASVDKIFDKINKAMGPGGRVDLMPAGMQVFLLEDCMTSITHVSYRFPSGMARRQVCLLGSFFMDPEGYPAGTRGSVFASVDHPALQETKQTEASITPSGFVISPTDVEGESNLTAVLRYNFHGFPMTMLRKLVTNSSLLTNAMFTAAEELMVDIERA